MQRIVTLLPSALSLTLLGAIESLLSAVVADGMTGDKHNSNVELAAQGAANIASVMFGGIPATGAIARTAVNVRSGARTRVAAIVHSLVLLAVVYLISGLVGTIPLAALSAAAGSTASRNWVRE